MISQETARWIFTDWTIGHPSTNMWVANLGNNPQLQDTTLVGLCRQMYQAPISPVEHIEHIEHATFT